MERLQELINQLQEQFDRKADPSQMLLTTRHLEAELNRLSVLAAASRSSAKVAVMMPSSMKIYTGQSAAQEARAIVPDNRNVVAEVRNGAELKNNAEAKSGAESKSIVPEPGRLTAETGRITPEPSRIAPEPAIAAEVEVRTAPELRLAPDPAAPSRSAASGKESFVQQPVVKQPIVGQQERGPWPFDPLADIPTLAQHQPREINDVIGLNGSSLNDKLKSNVLELKSALNDTPVRDLKKAIGVNDRFVFISQLFRGDEVMYERSLKTINGFRILPEAEYWMERELKVKLGWDETRETTRHFYQLVKRRFS